jgi:D-alanine-D-alanine ligase
MTKLKLGVLFGGVSAEHEVSIITGLQLIKNADVTKYDIVPIYVDKKGQWWTGEAAKNIEFFRTVNVSAPVGLEPFQLSLNPTSTQPIDLAILCFHGTTGESGGVQGLLEVVGIPHQGPSVMSAAISFDKIVTRQILTAEGIAQTPYRWFTWHDWQARTAFWQQELAALGPVWFVKPANSGSSIGIVRVTKPEDLAAAVASVAEFDQRILVEKAVTDCLEINVSVIRDGETTQVSVAEQPLQKDEFLSFVDKYQRGGGKKSGMASASRRIPAPISASTYEKLKTVASQVAEIFDFTGVIRIDFFVNPSTEEIFLTEPNTIPGSMSFYLWQASGMPYPQLIDTLIEIAQKRQKKLLSLTRSFDTNLLQTAQM